MAAIIKFDIERWAIACFDGGKPFAIAQNELDDLYEKGLASDLFVLETGLKEGEAKTMINKE